MEEKFVTGLVSLDASELQTTGGLTFSDFIKYATRLEAIVYFFSNYFPQIVKGFKDGYAQGVW